LPEREEYKVAHRLRVALTLALVLAVGTGFGQAQSPDADSAKENLDEADFYLAPRPNYKGSHWIFSTRDNQIVGYGPWDSVKRRWTLFNLRGQYQGFIQATLGPTAPPSYRQYLWYDKDNRYKGVFIASLGGRPVTPDLPYGELGGGLNIYSKGNIPLDLPSFEVEVDPWRLFPDGIILEPTERLPGK
jgi:hypothetical protein